MVYIIYMCVYMVYIIYRYYMGMCNASAVDRKWRYAVWRGGTGVFRGVSAMLKCRSV